MFLQSIRPETHLVDVRVAWSKAVKGAGLDHQGPAFVAALKLTEALSDQSPFSEEYS